MTIRADASFNNGSTFDAFIHIRDDNDQVVDLTGYTAKAQMKKHYSSLTAYNFVVDVDTLTGTIHLNISKTQSKLIPIGRYMYDCILYDGTTTLTLLNGLIEVLPGITNE